MKKSIEHPKNFVDITGMKFNRLTAIEYVGQGNSGAKWKFLCDCGKEIVTSGYFARKGYSKSCGCWNEENKYNRYRKHGMHKTRLYYSWSHIKQRCLNPKCREYKNYGGRGISICEDWKNNFEEFANWSYKNGYEENLTIDRIDNNGNYCPENCRWVNMIVQENNKRNNHYYEFNGQLRTLSQISREFNVSRNSLYYRINKKGMSVENALKSLRL